MYSNIAVLVALGAFAAHASAASSSFSRLGTGCCRNDCGNEPTERLILRDPPGGKDSWSNGDCKRACRANVECTAFEIDKDDGSHGKCELQLNTVIAEVDSETGRCSTGQISCWVMDASTTGVSSNSVNFERIGNGCCRNECGGEPEVTITLRDSPSGGAWTNGECKRACRDQEGCTGFEIDKDDGVNGKCELQIDSFITEAVTDQGSRCGTAQISCWRRTDAGEPDPSLAGEGSGSSEAGVAVPLVAAVGVVGALFAIVVVVRWRAGSSGSRLARGPKNSDEASAEDEDVVGDEQVVFYENPLHASTRVEPN